MNLKKEFLENILSTSFIAFLAFSIRTIVRRQKVTILSFVLDALASVFVGVMVGNAIHAYDFPPQVHIAIISLSGMIGPDILAGLLVLASNFKEKPVSFILKWIYAVRGVEDKSVSDDKPVVYNRRSTDPKPDGVCKIDTPKA